MFDGKLLGIFKNILRHRFVLQVQKFLLKRLLTHKTTVKLSYTKHASDLLNLFVKAVILYNCGGFMS